MEAEEGGGDAEGGTVGEDVAVVAPQPQPDEESSSTVIASEEPSTESTCEEDKIFIQFLVTGKLFALFYSITF